VKYKVAIKKVNKSCLHGPVKFSLRLVIPKNPAFL